MRRPPLLALTALALLTASFGRAADPAPPSGWLTYGDGLDRSSESRSPGAPVSLASSWFAPLSGRITAQPLVVRDLPRPGAETVYVATSAGVVYALSPGGYIRWRTELGQLAHPCPQLEGYGITGTPAIDPATRAIYVADAFGRLHALDLVTGAERPGWPVTLYSDYGQELVWGALAIVDGAVYAGTGSYCDQPVEGKVIRVSIATHEVSSWVAVPLALGGGGGVWGWGGIAYSARRDSLFAATGNAFQEDEAAGYGEQLVELSPQLGVRAASHPKEINQRLDLDFVGSPVVIDAPGCDELVAAQNKNGTLYGWRADDVSAGPIWSVRLQPADEERPLLTQPAWSNRYRSLYAVTFSELVRIRLGADCQPSVDWRLDLKNPTLNGSPTVAGDMVWLALSATPGTLLGVDAETGAARARKQLGGISFPGPTVLDGHLFLGETHGFPAVSTRALAGERPSPLPEYSSHGWQSRESGVYAGSRRIYPAYAVRVVRLSAQAGVISVGSPAPPCGCSTRQLWTRDGGRTWHVTRAIGPQFAGRGSTLVWWDGGALHRVAWPSLRSRLIAEVEGTIVGAVVVPGGVAALVSNRIRGSGWDNAPRVLLVRGGRARTLRLPTVPGGLLVRSLSGAWPSLSVRATDYAAFTSGRGSAVVWRSRDGGATWSSARN